MNELFESSYLSIMSAENDRLRKELQQKENIIKEIRELCEKQFINYETNHLGNKTKRYAPISANKIIETLDKENNYGGGKEN